jgi:sortase A
MVRLPSGYKRFLFVTSMLGSAAALVLAIVIFASVLPELPSEQTEIPTVVAAPLPPPQSPTPAQQQIVLPVDRPAPRQAGPPIIQVGIIEIPKIGLVHPVYEGIDLRVINRGPGHWPGSAMPGEFGNTVFAGHRVTHSHPFLQIDQLVPGDEVIFRTNAGTAVYHVTEHLIVYPRDVWIADPTPSYMMTIFACHPPRSARQRYVVRGRLVSTQPA